MIPLSVAQAIADIREGKFVIIVDDEDRENEGDLAIAAERVTPEAINFMTKFGRGLICVPMTDERLSALGLGPMVSDNTSRHATAFTVSVDVANGGTGISAFDRAATVEALLSKDTGPSDLARPGHMFPLAAQQGGVLVRAGYVEIDQREIAPEAALVVAAGAVAVDDLGEGGGGGGRQEWRDGRGGCLSGSGDRPHRQGCSDRPRQENRAAQSGEKDTVFHWRSSHPRASEPMTQPS